MVNCILTLAPAFQFGRVARPFPSRPTPPLRRRIGGKGLGPRLRVDYTPTYVRIAAYCILGSAAPAYYAAKAQGLGLY